MSEHDLAGEWHHTLGVVYAEGHMLAETTPSKASTIVAIHNALIAEVAELEQQNAKLIQLARKVPVVDHCQCTKVIETLKTEIERLKQPYFGSSHQSIDSANMIQGPVQTLTVIIRNDGPLVFCGDSPTYRSVSIPLTREQSQAIKLRHVGVNCGQDVHESLSKCFIEPCEEVPE